MGIREIRERSAQEIWKRLSLVPWLRPVPAQSVSQAGRAACFFFSPHEITERIGLIEEVIPGWRAELLETADQISAHRFSLLGYGPVDHGTKIDWQRDAVHDRKSRLVPWYRIPQLDFQKNGDLKVTWELGRMQYLPRLAIAFRISGDPKYVESIRELVNDWQAHTPYPLGVHWASSLEAAFRTLSLLWVRVLLAGNDSVSVAVRSAIGPIVARSAWHIEHFLSTYSSPNTHLLGEAVGLYFVGTLCPELAGAARWRKKGWEVIQEHARTRVRPDGAYYEQSTYYHVYALDLFLHARILAARNNEPIPAGFDDALKGMLEYLALLSQAGTPPRFGDDDGGRVFDGRRNRAEHLVDPLALGAAFYRTGIYKMPQVRPTEEMIWLLGQEGLNTFQTLPEWTGTNSARFPHAGVYVLHAGKGHRSQLFMDAGPLGGDSGGHGHADALSLTLNVDGLPILIDPGTGNYVGAGNERTEFRGTAAHNTATVDGLSQAEPRTPFSWHRWPEVEVQDAISTPGFDLIDASHDGYSRLADPVIHRRAVFSLHEGFWIVLDRFRAAGAHEIAVHWHVSPDCRIELQTEGRIAVGSGDTQLHMWVAGKDWDRKVEPGKYSPAYGAIEAASVLRVQKTCRGNDRVATLLWLGQAAGRLELIDTDAGHAAYRMTVGENAGLLVFSDRAGAWNIEDWESDAEFLYGRLDADGQPSRCVIVRGSYVRFRGKSYWGSAERPKYFDWRREGVS